MPCFCSLFAFLCAFSGCFIAIFRPFKYHLLPLRHKNEGVSLFIGLRGINGTLTTFLGLRTDFKRKLDLTVVAIPPKAGTLRR